MSMANSYSFRSNPTRPTPVMTIMNPDFTGITDNIATVWAGDIRVGRISFRKLTGTEVDKSSRRGSKVNVYDFYYVATLLMDDGENFDVTDGTAESAPIGVSKEMDRMVTLLEDIAERIEL